MKTATARARLCQPAHAALCLAGETASRRAYERASERMVQRSRERDARGLLTTRIYAQDNPLWRYIFWTRARRLTLARQGLHSRYAEYKIWEHAAEVFRFGRMMCGYSVHAYIYLHKSMLQKSEQIHEKKILILPLGEVVRVVRLRVKGTFVLLLLIKRI